MKHNSLPAALLAATTLATAGACAQAQTPPDARRSAWMPSGLSAQAGRTRDGTAIAVLGLQWHSGWRYDWWGGQLGYSTEAQLGHWRVDGAGGRESYTQLAVLPLLRNHFDGGRSPWFVEGGIGLTLTDNVYRSRDKQFSTAVNFLDVLGLGYRFGAAREHELGLRLAHISNANIKKPNPGTDTILVRYAYRF